MGEFSLFIEQSSGESLVLGAHPVFILPPITNDKISEKYQKVSRDYYNHVIKGFFEKNSKWIFINSLLYRFTFVPATGKYSSIKTFAVTEQNGHLICIYSPEFIYNIYKNKDQHFQPAKEGNYDHLIERFSALAFVTAHEMLHSILVHIERVKLESEKISKQYTEQEHKVWNIVFDAQINNFAKLFSYFSGFQFTSVPVNGIDLENPKTFESYPWLKPYKDQIEKGEDAESIVREILKNMPPEKEGGGGGQGGDGGDGGQEGGQQEGQGGENSGRQGNPSPFDDIRIDKIDSDGFGNEEIKKIIKKIQESSPEEAARNTSDLNDIIKNAQDALKADPRLKGKGFDRIVDFSKSKSTENWKEILKDFIKTKLGESNKRVLSPQLNVQKSLRRGYERGAPIAIRKEETLSNIIHSLFFVYDTSASIGDRELGIFFGETKNAIISSSYKFKNLWIMFCDQNIEGDILWFENINAGKLPPRVEKKISISSAGGGGTSFLPPFEFIDDIKKNRSQSRLNQISSINNLSDSKKENVLNSLRLTKPIVIYFTDGEGTFPTNVDFCHPFWVLCQKNLKAENTIRESKLGTFINYWPSITESFSVTNVIQNIINGSCK